MMAEAGGFDGEYFGGRALVTGCAPSQVMCVYIYIYIYIYGTLLVQSDQSHYYSIPIRNNRMQSIIESHY